MTTVALDLTALRSGNTGVARYARLLQDRLRADHPDVDLRTFTVGRGAEPEVPIDRHVAFPLRVVHRSWHALRWPTVERLVGPVDVAHALDMIPAPSTAPTVLTIHDLNPLRLPERYGERYVRIARAQLDAARTRVDVVLTTCAATAGELAEEGVPADRIVVAPLGHRPVPPTLSARPVDEPYLLYVGAVTPRKGLHVLVDAVGRLGDRAPLLVVAGPDGPAASTVHDAVAVSKARVRLVGRVSDEELDALYAHADVVCHPSEAEGFGMPVLEAMAFGAPVLAGATPQAAELLGDGEAGLLLPPRDAAAWSDAVEALAADEATRTRLGAAGARRAQAWTWERCAAVVADVYRTLTP